MKCGSCSWLLGGKTWNDRETPSIAAICAVDQVFSNSGFRIVLAEITLRIATDLACGGAPRSTEPFHGGTCRLSKLRRFAKSNAALSPTQILRHEVAFVTCLALDEIERREKLCAKRSLVMPRHARFRTHCAQCPLLDFPPRMWRLVSQVKSKGVTHPPVVELTAPGVPVLC